MLPQSAPEADEASSSKAPSRAIGVTLSGLAFIVVVVLFNEMVNLTISSSRLKAMMEEPKSIARVVSVNLSASDSGEWMASSAATSPRARPAALDIRTASREGDQVAPSQILAPVVSPWSSPPAEETQSVPGFAPRRRAMRISRTSSRTNRGSATPTPPEGAVLPPPFMVVVGRNEPTDVEPVPPAGDGEGGGPQKQPGGPSDSATPKPTYWEVPTPGTPPPTYDPTSPAAKRLEAILADPLAGCTDTWRKTMAEYAKFHAAGLRALREQRPDAPKAVVYECFETSDRSVLVSQDCGGLADRLVGLTHLFLFSVANKYLYFMDWPNHAVHFHSPFFAMSYNDTLMRYAGRTHAEVSYVGCPDRVGKCPLGLNESEVDSPEHFGAHVTHTRLNRGGIRWGTAESRQRLVDLGLDYDTAGGCAYHSLIEFNPSFIERYRPMALKILDPSHKVIAIHKRMGDKAMHLLENPEINWGEETWTCAEKRRALMSDATGLPVHYFFVADNQQYKDAAVVRYKDKLFTSDTIPIHLSKQQLMWDGLVYRPSPYPAALERLAGSLADWWLMSLADLIIMPGFSGYSRTAFAYSMKPAAVCTEPFEGQGLYGCHRDILQREMAMLGAGYR